MNPSPLISIFCDPLKIWKADVELNVDSIKPIPSNKSHYLSMTKEYGDGGVQTSMPIQRTHGHGGGAIFL